MKLRSLAALLPLLLTLTASTPARGQDGGFALNQLQPSPAGDVFFGVPSPYAAGHLAPNAYILFDYASQPISLGDDLSVVSAQGFMRLDVSMAFWDRLLVSVDVPLAIVNSGDDPAIANRTFTVLESPQMGDVRLGVRGRVWGDDGGPFQLGVGSYLFFPSGSREHYAGEGAVRGGGHAVIGGRIGNSVGFAYSAAIGAELRASDSPQALTYGAGAALLLGGDLIQVGPEFYGVTSLGGDIPLASTPIIMAAGGTNAEVMGSAKLRVLEGLTIGGAAGPGLGETVGTPIFRAMGMIGWTPLPGPAPGDDGDVVAAAGDKDDDGITDDIDACPEVPGEPNPDPTKDGCPPSDKDQDGVVDIDDACPNTAGLRSADATKNGCPKDSDDDGYHDEIDACPQIAGDPNDDPKKNGCPADDDEDGIANKKDACPTAVGDPHDDPDKNGCPPDPDGDGIRYADDACPNEKGVPDPDPRNNGCPRFVRMGKGSIQITQRIEFETYGDSLAESVTGNSAAVLSEVAGVIKDHPEFTILEVQGHTDDSGDEEFNVELSQRRAETVRRWLIDEGRHRLRAPQSQGLRLQQADRRQPHAPRPPEEPPRRVRHPRRG